VKFTDAVFPPNNDSLAPADAFEEKEVFKQCSWMRASEIESLLDENG
jgi:hypothetical protein